jgi:hypothetical protein
MGEQLGILLVADFPHMNFIQMHEHLRLELTRRIQRGALSVSLLARQTGLGQSHLSNFLNSKRQLSLQALDRVLSSQQMTARDLLPDDARMHSEGREFIPLVSHTAALFEPHIRPTSIRYMLPVPRGVLGDARTDSPSRRKAWLRFVAVSIPAQQALAMQPVVQAESVVLLDRHYNSLSAYRPGRDNLYAVRKGNRLALGYADFLANRLVIRPQNLAYPVDLLEIQPGESPEDLITGRIVMTMNRV